MQNNQDKEERRMKDKLSTRKYRKKLLRAWNLCFLFFVQVAACATG